MSSILEQFVKEEKISRFFLGSVGQIVCVCVIPITVESGFMYTLYWTYIQYGIL